MRRQPRAALIGIILSLASAAPAYPWGAEGHRALAIVAAEHLSADARSHVAKILGNDDLASISVWMDDLRSAFFHTGPLGSDPEALRFNASSRRTAQWHYVDIPLGAKAYELDGAFSNPHDVVHMAEEAVASSKGAATRGSRSARRSSCSCTSWATSTSPCTSATDSTRSAPTGR